MLQLNFVYIHLLTMCTLSTHRTKKSADEANSFAVLGKQQLVEGDAFKLSSRKNQTFWRLAPLTWKVHPQIIRSAQQPVIWKLLRRIFKTILIHESCVAFQTWICKSIKHEFTNLWKVCDSICMSMNAVEQYCASSWSADLWLIRKWLLFPIDWTTWDICQFKPSDAKLDIPTCPEAKGATCILEIQKRRKSLLLLWRRNRECAQVYL